MKIFPNPQKEMDMQAQGNIEPQTDIRRDESLNEIL